MSSICIAGGRVIDPATGVDELRDVLLSDGLVSGVDAPGRFAGVQVAETIDARGCIVAPGLIDIHVHLREPGQTYKETIATGTAAAAAGGFTSVVAMPNTVPVNDSRTTMSWMLTPERGPKVRLFAMPAVTVGSMGEKLTDFEALAAAGARGFTDDGKPVLDDAMMRAALLGAGRLGLAISQHAEDTNETARNGRSTGIHAGRVAFRMGLRGMSAESEWRIVERDIGLLEEIERVEKVRAHLHVQHVSTECALRAIRAAKAKGLHVTCEATPHHFTLTEEALGDFDSSAKMNPPLRPQSDRVAVIEGLLDGTIDCIATDHAPHARHEKEVEFELAPNGITGLETALGLALRVLHREHGMSLSGVLKLMTAAPARIAALEQAGSLAPGRWSDLVIFDAAEEWSFRAEGSYSKSRNTPFDQTPLLGRVKATIVGGKVVFKG